MPAPGNSARSPAGRTFGLCCVVPPLDPRLFPGPPSRVERERADRSPALIQERKNMRKALTILVAGSGAGVLSSSVGAQQLPKSGSINFHTGWKDTSDANEVADKRYQGQGRSVGTTFNDKG